jgi:3-mercaptopyruvate sulfurtransferase SseA
MRLYIPNLAYSISKKSNEITLNIFTYYYPFSYPVDKLQKNKMIEQQVLKIMAKNPQILDVRTPEEFTQGHIDDAVNVNWLETILLQT